MPTSPLIPIYTAGTGRARTFRVYPEPKMASAEFPFAYSVRDWGCIIQFAIASDNARYAYTVARKHARILAHEAQKGGR